MKLLLPLLLLSAATLSFAEEEATYRTFRDLQGRSVRAEIVLTGPDSIWIRRVDGQTFRVDRKILSKSDRDFVTKWERANELQKEDAIGFSISRFSDGSEQKKTKREKRAIKRFGYRVTLENRTTIDLAELSIEYRIFVQRGAVGKTGQDRELDRYPGFATISNLLSRKKAAFETESIELTSIALRSGSVFGGRDTPNSNQRKIRDDLYGIWIRVMENGKLIAEFSSPSTLQKKENWEPEDAWWLRK